MISINNEIDWHRAIIMVRNIARKIAPKN
uniref:Uncharacterized protein n=1 Tax=Rhizophora mucronata TaxID=61149 RepID=A0A2P2QX48_RHIMU